LQKIESSSQEKTELIKGVKKRRRLQCSHYAKPNMCYYCYEYLQKITMFSLC